MKKVVITGANRGIGKATAEKFLNEGWQVLATSTSGEGFAAENVTWAQLDLTDGKSITDAVEAIKAHEDVDIVINNAGIADAHDDVGDVAVTEASLRNTLEVNLIGTAVFTEQLLLADVIATEGKIFFTGSMLGSITDESMGNFMPAYRISKVGISMYAKTLAARLSSAGVVVGVLDPGWVQTDMGGQEANRTPEEPAAEYYELATTDVPTGKFWREGQERNW